LPGTLRRERSDSAFHVPFNGSDGGSGSRRRYTAGLGGSHNSVWGAHLASLDRIPKTKIPAETGVRRKGRRFRTDRTVVWFGRGGFEDNRRAAIWSMGSQRLQDVHNQRADR